MKTRRRQKSCSRLTSRPFLPTVCLCIKLSQSTPSYLWRSALLAEMRFLLLLSVAVAGISGSDIPRFTHASVEQRHDVFPRQQNTTEWPYGPYRTEGRDIVDSRGDVVTLAGVNW